MIIDERDFLEHYGKKGMKWGVRRNPNTGVRPIAKTLTESRPGRATQRYAERSAGSRRAMAGQKVGRAIRNHPNTAKTIGTGAVFAASFLAAYGASKVLANSKTASRIAQQARLDAERATTIAELAKKIGPMGRN